LPDVTRGAFTHSACFTTGKDISLPEGLTFMLIAEINPTISMANNGKKAI
jgi:hypothetical protein